MNAPLKNSSDWQAILKTTDQEEAVLHTVHLILKVVIIYLFYQVLSVLPPLQKLTLPNVAFTPLNALKVISFGLIAWTLVYSREDLKERFERTMPEKIHIASLSSHTVIFFAILFVYYGLRDVIAFPGQKSFGDSPWFLWTSVALMAIPIINAGLVVYNNSEDLLRFVLSRREIKRHEHNGERTVSTRV